jgi:endonuclease/exonuclease/phosphatase family metal-dependent hydrolase
MNRFIFMTYNVHSCIGKNGKASPASIAKVIAYYNPDVVALQELDIGLIRSGRTDQAQMIADDLKMDFHFHPSLTIEKGQYGNATLSRHPMKLIHAGELPTLPRRHALEKRGALWVEVMYGGYKIQILNTHLGLNRKERSAQIDTLLEQQWLKHPGCQVPIIFCGDFNASPLSKVYRKLRGFLHDIQYMYNKSPQKTWPSRFPILRLDYIFTSTDIKATNVLVPRTYLTRTASDHLPIIAELCISSNVNNTDDIKTRT